LIAEILKIEWKMLFTWPTTWQFGS